VAAALMLHTPSLSASRRAGPAGKRRRAAERHYVRCALADFSNVPGEHLG
jgi:hypothetical protein